MFRCNLSRHGALLAGWLLAVGCGAAVDAEHTAQEESVPAAIQVLRELAHPLKLFRGRCVWMDLRRGERVFVGRAGCEQLGKEFGK